MKLSLLGIVLCSAAAEVATCPKDDDVIMAKERATTFMQVDYAKTRAASADAADKEEKPKTPIDLDGAREMATVVSEKVMEVMEYILSIDTCWRSVETRGGQQADCGPNQEKHLLFKCKDKCENNGGYDIRRGNYCEKPCPAPLSRKPVLAHCSHTYFRECKKRFKGGKCRPLQGYHGCNSGYSTRPFRCTRTIDVERIWSEPTKREFCPHAAHPDGPYSTVIGKRCFEPEPKNFDCNTGIRTVCWSKCPPLMEKCGLGLQCGTSKAACGMAIADMSSSVLMACTETALLIASFGGTSAGGGMVGKTVLTAATRKGFATAAKESFKKFQKKLVQGATKAALKKMAVKKIKEEVAGYLEGQIETICDLAVEGFIQEFLTKSEASFDETTFEAFDPTGLATAIRTTVDDASSGLDKAKVWIMVAATLDPSGWIAAAAAFMQPKCHKM